MNGNAYFGLLDATDIIVLGVVLGVRRFSIGIEFNIWQPSMMREYWRSWFWRLHTSPRNFSMSICGIEIEASR